MFANLTVENLFRLLSSGVLEPDNRDRCVRIFYDTAKVIYCKQTRLHKKQLKMKEVASAIALVQFYHSSMFRFEATGELASNFGGCSEQKALEYFEQKVMGSIKDAFNRSIEVELSAMRFLYKEKDSGKHVTDSQNYEEVRGKRLPWVRHVIEKSLSVFVVEETVSGRFRRTHLYSAIASIPLSSGAALEYFIVVVSEDPNKNLRFVTAYHIVNHNRFLSRIEPGLPFTVRAGG